MTNENKESESHSGNHMKNVMTTEITSLNGVIESTEEWVSSYSNDEMEGEN